MVMMFWQQKWQGVHLLYRATKQISKCWLLFDLIIGGLLIGLTVNTNELLPRRNYRPKQIIPLSIQLAELLNDFDRCKEASAILQQILSGSHGTVKNIRVMDSLGYSKEALTARQKYFVSRSAQENGNRDRERRGSR